MTPVETDFEDCPAKADPTRAAIGNLLVVIMESTAEGSPERARAMNEALQAHERIKLAMRVQPRLN